MDIINNIGFICKKLRLRKIGIILQKILLKILHPSISYSYAEVDKVFNTIHSNPHNSCITQNIICSNPEYDLQIIIPAYNTASYIGDCLSSILNQKTKYKILVQVINDGSTDNTLDFITPYLSDSRVMLMNQSNSGQSTARNSALKCIKSRYIMFVDSDDLLVDASIDTLLDYAIETNADVVQGSWIEFCENKILNKHSFKSEKSDKYSLYGFPWGKVYKSHLFQSVCFPVGYWFEDTLISLVLPAFIHNVYTIEECVYKYRINYAGTSYRSRKNPKQLDTIYVTEQLLKDVKKLNPSYLKEPGVAVIILYQFRMNAMRLASFDTFEINYMNFLKSVQLYDTYVNSSVIIKDALAIEIRKALDERDYIKFISLV